jgi:two-component system phosphate regulon sensor histidine kinase PhoR
MRVVLSEALITLALALLASALAYMINGVIGIAVTAMLTLCFVLFRHLYWAGRLIRWLRTPLDASPPIAVGVWASIFDSLYLQTRKAGRETRQVVSELERLRLAAEVLPEGVLILDDHHAIEWMNREAEACLGLNAAADTGSRLTHLLREPALADYLEAAENRPVPLVFSTQRNPGRILQLQIAPIAAGRVLLMVRDVTQLEKLATMRRDFVANVSHELKTPLTVTLGFIETAIDALGEATAEELAGYLRTAAEQARRMQHLIEDLLILSSLETDSPPREEDVNLSGLLAAVREEAAALSAGRHHIDLEISGATYLSGSERELHSAFGNLATNAVRYTPTGGRIRLRWSTNANGGRFSVEDQGIGIAEAHLPRLTERFYRVDHGRAREMGGTGLGLAIVKHVLERHQAHLEIVSTLGKGSTFTAAFPSHRVHE